MRTVTDSNTAGHSHKLTWEAPSEVREEKNKLVCDTARKTLTLLPGQNQHLEQEGGNKRQQGLCVFKDVTSHRPNADSDSVLQSGLIEVSRLTCVMSGVIFVFMFSLGSICLVGL